MHSTAELENQVAELRRQLERLQGLPEEVRQLKARIEELEEQLAEALESNRKLVEQLNTMDANILKVLVAMQGDAGFRRKGIVDDLAELKEGFAGLNALKLKFLGGVAVLTAIGVGGAMWIVKHLSVFAQLLEK